MMAAIIFGALFAVVLCFGLVVLVGAPYLPTLDPQVQAALQLAKLRRGDRLLELGCGDGKVLVATAKRGVYVTGYELNPLLALIAWLRTRRYRKYVTVKWGNFWWRQWPEVDVIFTFLLPRYMAKLDAAIIQRTSKPVRLVSIAFAVTGKAAAAEKAGVYLYRYPAPRA